jgi:hypothetical protein
MLRFWRESEHSSVIKVSQRSTCMTGVKVEVKFKLEIKLSLCLTKDHAMTTYWRVEVITPRIIDFGTTWKWVFSFTRRPLYTQGKSSRYSLDRRLGGHRAPELVANIKIPSPFRESNTTRPNRGWKHTKTTNSAGKVMASGLWNCQILRLSERTTIHQRSLLFEAF